MTTPDVSITLVLAEIRGLSEELVALRADVKLALTHSGDVEKLLADVKRIDEHLKKIDEFMAGPPALTERLAALERKQEADHESDSSGVTGAGTADDSAHRKSSRGQAVEVVGESEQRQSAINAEFRAGLGRLEAAIFDILHASLKVKASLILGGAVIIFILARALGA